MLYKMALLMVLKMVLQMVLVFVKQREKVTVLKMV